MRNEYNRKINNADLSKKMFENYLPSFFSSDQPQSKENYILLLTVLCGFVSKEEIVSFTGMPYTYCEKIIKSLLRKKYVETIRITLAKHNYVSRTNTLYTFTKKGYDYAKGLDEGKKIINPYRKKTENSKNIHDYLSGMNLFACLIGLNGCEFGWVRERVYGNYRRDKKTLATDCEILLAHFTLHIEEDIGNEQNDVILDKLFSYQKYPNHEHSILSSDEDALLISYYKPAFLENAAYHQKGINALADMVKNLNPSIPLENAFQGILLTPVQKKTLESLYCEAGRRKNGKSVLTVSDLLEMSGRFSSENPFYQNACRKDQYEKCRKKKRNLFRCLYEAKYQPILDDIFKGSAIYIAPTLLLDRYIHYICQFPSLTENLSFVLSSYFGALRGYAPRGYLGNNTYLRNSFCSDAGYVYIEFPTIDLGALFRIHRFLQQSRNLSGHHHLILLIDHREEAFEIAKWIGDFDRAMDQSLVPGQEKLTYLFINKDRRDIYYLLRADLEGGLLERLFSVTGYKEFKNDEGEMVGVGKFEIFSLISESNPILKEEG